MPRSMIEIIERLSPLRLAPNSPDTDRSIAVLQEELPFAVQEFPAGKEVNGWIVPQSWWVEKAEIRDASGTLLYDGLHHPLAVIGYSRSFTGSLGLSELKKHLFFTQEFDDALVYHCDLYYKPFREEWGFSVPRTFRDALPDGQYQVELRTRFDGGTMKVAEHVLPGLTPDSIVLNAHNCHAFCCNDDLSGIAVGIEVMRRLAALPERRFTYRLIVAPEHFGSICYLDACSDAEARRLKWAIFLESLGTNQPLALQRSFTGQSLLDRALVNVLSNGSVAFRDEPFRKVVGNDETCWEAAGYEVPCVSLSRMPFPEYHTSRDAPGLMRLSRLEEAVSVVMETLHVLETDCTVTRRFKGLVALSHPRYDLYKAFWDPSEEGRRTITEAQRRWNYLMDCLPRYFDGQTRTLEIAERHQLPFRAVRDYVRDFVARGLAESSPAPASNPAPRALPPST